jgi:cytochrome c oxidase cbb3-type subunit III
LRVFREHCAGCHRAQGVEGGLTGPALEGVESRRSLADLRQSILQPDAVVSNEYWSVDIQAVQGERLRGVRLNEDTSSIQIREPNGRLRSILRPEIAKIELIRTSPMPSFAGKLSDPDLNHILAFLSATGNRGSAAAR